MHAAKTQLSRLVERAERGEEVVIARGSTPVVRLTRLRAERPARRFGAMRGRARVGRAFFEPLPESELKRWEQPVRLLLDTHALLWWLDGDRRLSLKARRAIANQSNTIFVSAASAWEITTKARLGRLPGATDVAADVAACVAGQGFLPLDITMLHAQRAGRLPGEHRDPFDRMLIAQSQMEDIALLTDDEAFDDFDVRRFWQLARPAASNKLTLSAASVSTLTIRLDDALERELQWACARTGRTRSELARDALRRQPALLRFERLRRRTLPLAESQGYLTDEDIVRDAS